jgi:hypothetical protein
MHVVFLYVGSAFTSIWGIPHLIATKNAVAGFGEISDDNRRIITMEWSVEGVSLIFIGALVAAVTFIDPDTTVSRGAYAVSAAELAALALVSLFTGFKVRFLPYRLCPFIFAASAILVIAGGLF